MESRLINVSVIIPLVADFDFAPGFQQRGNDTLVIHVDGEVQRGIAAGVTGVCKLGVLFEQSPHVLLVANGDGGKKIDDCTAFSQESNHLLDDRVSLLGVRMNSMSGDLHRRVTSVFGIRIGALI
jgi:hypothetical protein